MCLESRIALAIEEFLFSISDALLWPVLVLALVGLAGRLGPLEGSAGIRHNVVSGGNRAGPSAGS